jgi:DNA invertase Pin-like site-specific DNA recombinase
MKSKQLQLNRKVGNYYRLSKDDEKAGESLSIENQRLILQKYVAEQGWELVDEYIDDGYSGTNFDRPEVQRLLEDAKNGRIDIIVVKDLSRFGRNYIQVGQYVDYIFPLYNIRFIALSDNVDTADTNSSGMDMMPIMNVFNEWHSANTSKKIRAVIEANARAGKYRTTFAPYGYIKGADEKKLPIVDEPAASNVRRIFEMRASGISPRKIAEVFNEESILIPTDYRCQRDGTTTKKQTSHLWQADIVKQILRNPIYLGHLVQCRSTTVSYKNKKHVNRDESEQVVIRNTHEAIISQELWDKCREVEASVSQGKRNKSGVTQPLSGLMYCADCGGKMRLAWNNTRHKRTDPRTYHRENYNCGNYSRFGKFYCTSHYIKLKEINALVLMDIRSKAQLVIDDEKQAREDFLKRKERLSSEEKASDKKKLQTAQNRLAELDMLIVSVYEDKVLKKVPEEICVNLLGKYQTEKTELQAEVLTLEKKVADTAREENDVDEFIRRLKRYTDVDELTREMCLELIEYITIDKCPGRFVKDPREVHIYYKLIDEAHNK